MMELTPDAQICLNNYLERVRLSLHGFKSIDPEEVERDINDHIDRELIGKESPIGLKELEDVLKKLGSPDKWVPEEEVPPWRRILRDLHSGREDWRLAYISFSLLLLGLAFSPTGFLGLSLIMGSFCLSRAAVSVIQEHGDEIGPRKWLIYPSLIIVYSLLVIVPLFFVVRSVGAFADAMHGHGLFGEAGFVILLIVTTVPAICLLGLGLLVNCKPEMIRIAFRPFIMKHSLKFGSKMIGWGIGMVAVAIALCVSVNL